MLTKNKTQIRKRLLAWYRKHARDLPWRRDPSPYRTWISEIMLQQTQVETVKPYYQRFLAAFPDVHSLARATEDRVLKLWEGLGYYRRARLLKAAAERIVQRGGKYPATAREWLELPGIGRYTAGAIASIAMGEAAPILDGNVKRVLARIFGLRESIDASRTTALLWQWAEDLVPRRSPGDFNQAMMELGALVCLPRSPNCPGCPLAPLCQARAMNAANRIPARSRRPAVPTVKRAVAVIRRSGRYLLARRPAEGLLGGLWEFPGEDQREGEEPEQALRRLLAKTGLKIESDLGPAFIQVRHAYSHFRVEVSAFAVECLGRPKLGAYTRLAWVRRNQWRELALSKVDRRIAARAESL